MSGRDAAPDPHPLPAADDALARTEWERAERMVNLAQARVLLHCSESSLRRWRKKGLIREVRWANGWIYISLAEINRFKAHHTSTPKD